MSLTMTQNPKKGKGDSIMGMAATQARYLSLVAQQSNLENQGQQINQERSILSQQVSELYNTLLALEVPTPPATTDYQAVQYSGNIGATQYVFDAANVKPGKDNTYIVTLGYTSHEGGVIVFSSGSSNIIIENCNY